MLRFEPYATILFVGGVFSLLLAAVAFERNRSGEKRKIAIPGLPFFIGMLAAVGLWSIAYAIELGRDTLDGMLLLIRIEHLGIATCPVLWFLFALAYSGHRGLTNPGVVAALFVFPAVMIAIAVADPAGGWLYKSVTVDHSGPFPILRFTPGPFYYANVFYSYAAILGGMIPLWRLGRRSGRALRAQSLRLIAAAAIPLAANLFHLAGIRPSGQVDPTPFAFLLTNLIIGGTLIHFRLFHLIPVARDTVFEGLADGYFVFDEVGRLIDTNAAARRILGFDPSESDDAGRIFSAWPELAAVLSAGDGAPRILSLTSPSADGEGERHYEVKVEFSAEERETPRHKVVVWRDVTQRARREEALARSLRFERLLMEISLRFVNVPLELLDATIESALREVGIFCHVDRAYLFRCDEETAVMRNSQEWCAPGIEPQIDTLQEVPYSAFHDMIQCLKKGEPWSVPDVTALPPDSPARRQLLRQSIKTLIVVPMLQDGKLLGFVGFDSVRHRREWDKDSVNLLKILAGLLTNAIERGRAEVERLRAEDERRLIERRFLQAQKLESLGLLAGGIAHDFNNLLAAIIGNMDLAAAALPPGHPAVRPIHNALQASRRAADLTRQILAYAGKGQFLIGPVDLGALLRENAEILRAAIPKTTRLSIHCPDALPRIIGDASQIQQVIMNLLINASESLEGEPGDVHLSVSEIVADDHLLAASRIEEKPSPGRFLQLTVRDTGCGMDVATQEKIFEPFFTTKFTGRGLGMPAVLGIVRAHKGALLLDSTPGVGTEIRILLPLGESADESTARPMAEQEPETANASRPSAQVRANSGKPLICIVDDEEAIRMVCREALEQAGFRALPFATGRSFLSALENEGLRPDLVLIDLTMPDVDGAAILARISRQESPPPVVVISGYGEAEVIARLSGQKPAGILRKPFTLSALTRMVRDLLPC